MADFARTYGGFPAPTLPWPLFLCGARQLGRFSAQEMYYAVVGAGAEPTPELVAAAFYGTGPSGKPRAPQVLVKQSL